MGGFFYLGVVRHPFIGLSLKPDATADRAILKQRHAGAADGNASVLVRQHPRKAMRESLSWPPRSQSLPRRTDTPTRLRQGRHRVLKPGGYPAKEAELSQASGPPGSLEIRSFARALGLSAGISHSHGALSPKLPSQIKVPRTRENGARMRHIRRRFFPPIRRTACLRCGATPCARRSDTRMALA